MWHIHTIEYYLAVKMTEILIHATRWMNIENLILSEGSQSQKAIYVKCYIIPIYVECPEYTNLEIQRGQWLYRVEVLRRNEKLLLKSTGVVCLSIF